MPRGWATVLRPRPLTLLTTLAMKRMTNPRRTPPPKTKSAPTVTNNSPPLLSDATWISSSTRRSRTGFTTWTRSASYAEASPAAPPAATRKSNTMALQRGRRRLPSSSTFHIPRPSRMPRPWLTSTPFLQAAFRAASTVSTGKQLG